MIACGDYIIPGGPSPISRLRNDLVSPANFDYKKLSLNRHFSGGHLEQKAAPITAKAEDLENWWDFCPICNTKLVNQKCKYICPSPKCNFFMSCSEFDL